jgi:glycosyltransferase involved in cell wall biosynthesis
MKRVLMVAYHFPPLTGSSGIQRTLRFVQHLPKFGWQPLVLSTTTGAYERISHDLDSEMPPGTVVRRAVALDSARHLSLWGRHVAALARPDRWMSWRFDGVRQGMKMIREFRPDVLWSTYPIATAHLIGAELHRRSGIPWVADFRDPMAQDGYPADPATWQQFKAIEEQAAEQAHCCMFTTPGAARVYRERYPEAAARIVVLENGYDEESFAGLQTAPNLEALNPGAFTLLHSGLVYPQERDPTQLFEALHRLKASRAPGSAVLKIRFRAAVHDQLIHRLAAAHGVQDLVEVCPPLPYTEALQEMLRADALLVLQAANCNEQIPAKIYEYLRAGRPIVCLSDPQGDTVGVLRRAGVDMFAALDSVDQIETLLTHLLTDKAAHQVPTPEAVADASRQGRTASLASYLNRIMANIARDRAMPFGMHGQEPESIQRRQTVI